MASLIRRLAGAVTLLAAGLLLASCAAVPDSGIQKIQQNLVWPKPPAKAKLEYIRSISSPADLGIKPGFWNKLAGWFVGNEETRLVRPAAVAMTPDEVLFIADPGLGAVHRLDIRKKNYDVIRLEEDIPFRSPIGLALGPKNQVYVSDSGLNQIFVIEDGAEYASPLPTSTELNQPTGITVNNNRLYVVNTLKHEILAFDLDGKFLFRFGRRGAGKGEFNFPTLIWSAPDTHNLWVTDSLNFRVQQLDDSGRFLSTFGGSGDATGDLPRPKGVAIDRNGNIYVLDSLFNSMQIFNPVGNLLLYVGKQGRKPGQFWLPTGIFIDSKDRVFVADSFNNRIQVFRYLVDK